MQLNYCKVMLLFLNKNKYEEAKTDSGILCISVNFVKSVKH